MRYPYLLIIAISAAFVIDSTAQNTKALNLVSMKTTLTLEGARQIAFEAEQEALKNQWNVSIAIVNDAGQLIYFIRMDGSPNSSVDIAIAKAKHSANYRRDTKFHQNLIEEGNNLVLTLPETMPIEGGLQLIYEGQVVGAIGVSGVASENDGKIAQAGAKLLVK